MGEFASLTNMTDNVPKHNWYCTDRALQETRLENDYFCTRLTSNQSSIHKQLVVLVVRDSNRAVFKIVVIRLINTKCLDVMYCENKKAIQTKCIVTQSYFLILM